MPQTGKPRFHTYWNSFITTTLTFISTACLSFTGTANAMNVLHLQGAIDRAPAPETCIQWEMKFGLHKLTRPKEAADDWIWIADHVVSKGIHKCLVVLGVRMSTLSQKRDLTISCEDVEPLGIVPMKSSSGGLIEVEFEEILDANHGIPPLAIIKDQGSDLRCGGRRFKEAHPSVIDIHDVPHKIARLYEHELKNDVLWKKFSKACADFKKQVQLTEYADMAPPNQRSKARYHNIDVLVDWGIPQLSCYRELPKERQKKLEWLCEYSKGLACWKGMIDVGRVGRDFVRKHGIYLGCCENLEDSLMSLKLCPRANQLACDLIDFVEEEGSKVPAGKRVIGSSEIIESLFGKHKYISARGPKPMGRLILSMASRVGQRPTEALVETAFELVKEKDIDIWLQKAFG